MTVTGSDPVRSSGLKMAAVLFAAEAEGAAAHAGTGRRVEEERRREGGAGQEEGEEFI